MVYDPDGQPPQIHGRKEILTVTEPDGGEPEISGVEPVGEVFLTKAEVAAIPRWVAVEKKIKEGLEAKWQKQQAALAPAPPPTASPPITSATLKSPDGSCSL